MKGRSDFAIIWNEKRKKKWKWEEFKGLELSGEEGLAEVSCCSWKLTEQAKRSEEDVGKVVAMQASDD